MEPKLYCEAEFDPSAGQAPCVSDKLFDGGVAQVQLDVAIGSHRAAMRAPQLGTLAQQILDRLSVPALAGPARMCWPGINDKQIAALGARYCRLASTVTDLPEWPGNRGGRWSEAVEGKIRRDSWPYRRRP